MRCLLYVHSGVRGTGLSLPYAAESPRAFQTRWIPVIEGKLIPCYEQPSSVCLFICLLPCRVFMFCLSTVIFMHVCLLFLFSMKLVILLLPCCIFIYRTCLVILCIVNVYQTHIILETMDWGNRRRLTKTLTSICDGAGRRCLCHSHPVDANQLCYLL